MSNKKTSVGARIIQGLQEFAEVLEKQQPLADQFNCRVFHLDLQPTTYGPKLVKKTRQILNASQTVFAQFLGVSPKTVRAWEQGMNTPSDLACRFMDEIRRDPPYWQKRLQEAAVIKKGPWPGPSKPGR